MMDSASASKGDCCEGRRRVNGPARWIRRASLGSAAERAARATSELYGGLRVGPERGRGMRNSVSRIRTDVDAVDSSDARCTFLINEKSEGSGESGPVWLFDNRLTHRTSLNWSGSPLQTCPNRLLYFGSRSSVGLVGFPTDR